MSAPPSTPASRRFLAPKRQNDSGTTVPVASSTPIAPSSGPSRFARATPRFRAPPSTYHHSTQSGTAAQPGGNSARPIRYADPICDDSSSDGESRQDRGEEDAILASDSVVSQSEDEAMRARREGGTPSPDSQLPTRSPKRRRISISPEAEDVSRWDRDRRFASPRVDDDEGGYSPNDDVNMNEDPSHSLPLSPSPDPLDSEYEDIIDVSARSARATTQQPTFRKPPRFKLTDSDMAQADGVLPDAFSPQKRNVKFLPGGLAAELQSWLSSAKSWEGDVSRPRGEEVAAATASVRIKVDSVRASDNAYFAEGRKVKRDISSGGDYVSRTTAKIVLAGEGKLTGLGRRADVATSDIVAVDPPTWDINLADGGESSRWIIACNWSILPSE